MSDLGFSYGTREIFGLLEHATHGCSFPQVLMFDPEVSVSPCCPQMMGNHGLPGETGLSWEAGTGKAGLSGQENWPVRGVDKRSIPLAGLQLLLGIARQKCQFKFIRGGECKASSSTWEPLVKAVGWTHKQKWKSWVCVHMFVYPFLKLMENAGFSPHFWKNFLR